MAHDEGAADGELIVRFGCVWSIHVYLILYLARETVAALTIKNMNGTSDLGTYITAQITMYKARKTRSEPQLQEFVALSHATFCQLCHSAECQFCQACQAESTENNSALHTTRDARRATRAAAAGLSRNNHMF